MLSQLLSPSLFPSFASKLKIREEFQHLLAVASSTVNRICVTTSRNFSFRLELRAVFEADSNRESSNTMKLSINIHIYICTYKFFSIFILFDKRNRALRIYYSLVIKCSLLCITSIIFFFFLQLLSVV